MDVPIHTYIGMAIFTAFAVAEAAVSARGAYLHRKSSGWPSHAIFHTVEKFFYTLGLSALVIVVAWIPFREGQDWSWWAMLFLVVATHGGHLLGDLVTGGGLRSGETAQGPGRVFYAQSAMALVAGAVGLAISYTYFY